MTIAEPRAEPRARQHSGVRDAFGYALRSGKLPALVTALCAAALVYGFLWSGDFAVERVVVRGVERGDVAEVAAAADALDASVFRVEAGDLAERVVALPWVERADVRVELPDSVTIEVVERVPVVVWQGDGQSVLVDARGNVLFARDDGQLPHVTANGSALRPGDTIAATDVAAAREIHEQLSGTLGQLALRQRDGFVASLTDGRTVIFGDAERVPEKLAVVTAVLAQQEAQELDWSTLDVREPERPAMR